MRTVYGQPVTLEVDRLTDELLARIDLATGITAAQRVAGAVPILNNAETALVWSNYFLGVWTDSETWTDSLIWTD